VNGRWLWPAASKKEQGGKSGETNVSKPAAAKTNKGRKAGKKSGETDARPDAAQPVGDSADLGASRAVDTGAREWWLPRLTPKPPSKRLDGELIPLPHELLTERHAASELS
jgi:hypothetical protein